MKNNLIMIAFFCIGCLAGVAGRFHSDMHDVSLYVLYALLLQVGVSIGSNKKLKELVKGIRLKMLLVPVATISGTLLFSCLAGFFLSRWSLADWLSGADSAITHCLRY